MVKIKEQGHSYYLLLYLTPSKLWTYEQDPIVCFSGSQSKPIYLEPSEWKCNLETPTAIP